MGDDSIEFRRLQALGRRDVTVGEWVPLDAEGPKSVTINRPSPAHPRLLDYEPLATQSWVKRFWQISSDAIEDTLGFTLLVALFALFIGMLIDTPSGVVTFSVCLPAIVLALGLLKIVFDIRRRLRDRPRGRP